MSETNRDSLYELYALGLLEEPERSEVETELRSGSAEAQRLLRAAMATNAMISTMVPDVEPPARLRRRILAAAGVEEKTGWTWFGAWGLATAGLLAGFVFYGTESGRLRNDAFETKKELAVTQAQLRKTESTLAFLRSPGTTVLNTSEAEERKAVARVFVNPERGVLLFANNLPKLDSGKVFAMWLVPKSGAPRPAGTFRADEAGGAVHLNVQGFDLAGIAAVALSVEPEGGSPAPTTTPFLVTGV